MSKLTKTDNRSARMDRPIQIIEKLRFKKRKQSLGMTTY